MTGTGIAVGVGVGLLGLFAVYKLGKSKGTLATTNPLGTGSAGVNGAAPGSSTGTGTSGGLTLGKVGSAVSHAVGGLSVKSVAEDAIGIAVVGTPYLAYKGVTTVISWL